MAVAEVRSGLSLLTLLTLCRSGSKQGAGSRARHTVLPSLLSQPKSLHLAISRCPLGCCREHLAFPHGSGIFGHGYRFPVMWQGGSCAHKLAQGCGGALTAPIQTPPALIPPHGCAHTHLDPSRSGGTAASLLRTPVSPGSLHLFSCCPLLLTPPWPGGQPLPAALGPSSAEAAPAEQCWGGYFSLLC